MFLNCFASGFSQGFGYGMFCSNPFLFGGFSFGFGNPFMFSNMSMCMYPSVFSGSFYPLMPPINPPQMNFSTFGTQTPSLFQSAGGFDTFNSGNLDFKFPDFFYPSKAQPSQPKTSVNTVKPEENNDNKESSSISKPEEKDAKAEKETEQKNDDKTSAVKQSTQTETRAVKTETKTEDQNGNDLEISKQKEEKTEEKSEEKPDEKNEEKTKKHSFHIGASISNAFRKIFHHKKKAEKPEEEKAVENNTKTETDKASKATKKEKAKKNEKESTLRMCAISDAPNYSNYDDLILKYAKKYDVDPLLVKALIKQESKFNPNAKSYAGAKGLTQLMPGTAKEMGVTNPYDANQSIKGGTKYLKWCLDNTKTVEEALVAYNAGLGNLRKAQKAGKKIDSITDHGCYAKSVLGYYNEYKQLNVNA